ncbi:hypothetical protein D3C81_1915550 [compost metagenome]
MKHDQGIKRNIGAKKYEVTDITSDQNPSHNPAPKLKADIIQVEPRELLHQEP